MAEQETVQKSEYDLELESIEAAYDEKVRAVDKFDHLAHKKIPRLTQLLEAVQPDGTTMSEDDIRDQIHKDCKKYWSPNWIEQCLPDKFKRKYEQTGNEGETDEDSDTLSSTPATDNPQADLIRELKQQLKGEQKARVDAQKLYDKADTKIKKMSTEIDELKNEVKGFRKGAKLLDIIKPMYDEELNALTVNVTGNSNLKLTEYFEQHHKTKPLSDTTRFVFKLGNKTVLELVD